MKITFQMFGTQSSASLFFGLLLFWPAGTFDYWQAWVFIAVFAVGDHGSDHLSGRDVPRRVQRRMHSGPFAETRMVQKLINVGIMLSVVAVGVISALDHRFGWSTVPTPVVVVGNVLVLVGLCIAKSVVIQNNYAAATITVEEEQPVVSTGLYGLVRHPMYVGALIMMVGTPLALASYWGLLTLIPGVLVFVARVTDEEKALREELDGYDEYTEKVHYRLVPGVW